MYIFDHKNNQGDKLREQKPLKNSDDVQTRHKLLSRGPLVILRGALHTFWPDFCGNEFRIDPLIKVQITDEILDRPNT